MDKKPRKVVFKPFCVEQQYLIPQSLDELIPKNHLVRTVNRIIEQLPLGPFFEKYPGGGASSYHPAMLLRVLVYGYIQRIYTSRKLAKAVRENIHFMWLSGGNQPDFRTIARFRSGKMVELIEGVFATVVELLHETGYLKLEDYFLDGTKIESGANKYSFVWGKATVKFKSRLQKQVKALFRKIEDEQDDEDSRHGDRDLDEMGEGGQDLSAELLERKLGELTEKLSKEPEDKEGKKAAQKIADDYLPRLRKYEAQERLLGDRNSYSKTDPDATFMRMKEDHMHNGQLKPAYNVQIGTEKQFVVCFSIHQRPTDTRTLKPHLEKFKTWFGRLPKNLIADAGYGSEENYQYLDDNSVAKYVKYNYFHLHQKKSFKKKKFHAENLPYDPQSDTFTCPEGKNLAFVSQQIYTTDTGYQSLEKTYQCEDCSGCLSREQCHTSKYNRRLSIRPKLKAFKEEVKELLISDQGKKFRSLRPIEPEPVFSHIKTELGLKRFLLKGLEKVKVEWGLACLAHNLMKMAKLGLV